MYFSVTKSTKSHLRGLSSLLKNTFRVHELVARAMRGKCVRHRAELKSAMSRFPWFQPYHACEHITRKSRADSCTHCLHARIIGLAGVNLVCALTKARIFASLLQWGIDRFAQANAVGVAETGAEGVSHRLTDEVSFKKRVKILCVYRAFGHSKAR